MRLGRPRVSGTKHLVVGNEVQEGSFCYKIIGYDIKTQKLTCLSKNNGNSFDIALYDAYKRGVHSADRYYPTVYGVGFIGDGQHTPTVDWKMSPPYNIWHNMLQRCYYSRKDGNNRTYINVVTVDEKWHNFQVFAEWFNKSNYQKGWDLDKDLLGCGLIYSESSCVFIPPEINGCLRQPRNKRYGKELPFAIFDHKSGSYRVVDKETGKFKYFKNLDDALSFRNQTLKIKLETLANKYKSGLPEIAFENLINFNVEKFYEN